MLVSLCYIFIGCQMFEFQVPGYKNQFPGKDSVNVKGKVYKDERYLY